MVLQATGASWLTLMMRAERSRDPRAGRRIPDDNGWPPHGPIDLDVVDDEGQVRLLAAE
jgi:hypothetical protein